MTRPSKYNKELQKKFDDLVENFGNQVMHPDEESKKYNNRLTDEYFTFGDVNQIAVYLGIIRDTVYDWKNPQSDRYEEEFSYTYKKWETKRNALLFRIVSYVCQTNTALGIFLLKAQGGYLEINKHELIGRNGKDLPQPLNIKQFNMMKLDKEMIEKELEMAEAYGADKELIQKTRSLAAKLFNGKEECK